MLQGRVLLDKEAQTASCEETCVHDEVKLFQLDVSNCMSMTPTTTALWVSACMTYGTVYARTMQVVARTVFSQ